MGSNNLKIVLFEGLVSSLLLMMEKENGNSLSVLPGELRLMSLGGFANRSA